MNVHHDHNQPVFRDSLGVLLHGSGGGHAVEKFKFLAVPLHEVASRLVMPRKHASNHHKIGASAKRLRHITRARATSIL